MVKNKNIEEFRKKLKDIICKNAKERHYSEVWLSEADFGGLYQSDKFILNVKAEHDLDSCNEEIIYLNRVLFNSLSKEELGLIWRIAVYNSSDQIHCLSADILVYNEEEACKQ